MSLNDNQTDNSFVRDVVWSLVVVAELLLMIWALPHIPA